MLFAKSITEVGNYYDIKDFPIKDFNRMMKKYYKTTKLEKLTTVIGLNWVNRSKGLVRIHKFFIPEIIFLLVKFDFPSNFIQTIIDNTWYCNVCNFNSNDNRIDMNLISNDMNTIFKPYQLEFIQNYDTMKTKMELNGLICAMEQGLGKSLTSLGLMTGLNKSKVIIICPKSIMSTVWENEINTFYKKKKKIFIINQTPYMDMSYDYYIFNYESLNKIKPLLKGFLKYSNDIGIIVDESHNFLRKSSKRTQLLIDLQKSVACNDMLLMSGTPIKALGSEIIPMLFVLDKYFDNDAMEIFKKALGVNTTIATDIIRNRLHSMMYRKTKKETLNLPEKIIQDIKVTLPDGDKYTLTNIRKLVDVFVKEREIYHEEHRMEYVNTFNEVIQYLRNSVIGNSKDFMKYVEYVNLFNNSPVNMQNSDIKEKVMWVNTYEKDIILPMLPSDIKKKFNYSKSAFKYIHLKIRGEVLGGLLSKLRTKMTSELVYHAGLKDIINSAFKKTILFTNYIDTVEVAEEWCYKNHLNPITIYGKNSKNIAPILDTFKKDKSVNPLIASLSTIETGVTLTVANTIVFLNNPWRAVNKSQASDRIHRIGQDTVCYIYTVLLDTGTQKNLSTSMNDIVEFSKAMFTEMVGEL